MLPHKTLSFNSKTYTVPLKTFSNSCILNSLYNVLFYGCLYFSFIIENNNLFIITIISKNLHLSFQYKEHKHFIPSFIIIKTINYYLLYINSTPFHNQTISLQFILYCVSNIIIVCILHLYDY